MNSNNNQNNNYSEILRIRSHEFYSSVLRSNNSNFGPIFRSNSSLSLDQKRIPNNFRENSLKKENSFQSNNSLDFKDFQELRECRTTTQTTRTSSKASTKSSSKSLTSQSLSNENLNKLQIKPSKFKTKLFFNNKDSKSRDKSEADVGQQYIDEELRRRQRLRQLFVHYDVQSSISYDELFPTTATTATPTTSSTDATPSTSQDVHSIDSNDVNVLSDDDLTQNELNSNSLLGFSQNFRNEIGKELVYCLQSRREERLERRGAGRNEEQNRCRREPIHSTALSHQLSCMSSFDSNEVSQSSHSCPYNTEFDFNSNVLEIDFGLNYYRKYFYGFEHQNWFQVLDINNVKTSIALSLRKDKQKYRIILRTNHSLNALKGFLKINSDFPGNSMKELFELLFPKYLTSKTSFMNGFRLGFDSKSDDLLLKLDEILYNKCFKIGILYSKQYQSTEEDFYNNKDINDKDFDDFLSIIGSRVRLKDYKGYRAGLDVLDDTTGLWSFSTKFKSFDIMYHVLHELPFTTDKQQLLRKRHIGNDIVTIIFQSRDFKGKPFNPQMIRSHFQHIFIVIRPYGDGYRVALARHKAVPSFGPPLKTYYTKSDLRDFLLTKIINAENHCHKVNKFKQMALRTRFEYLNDLFMNYATQTSIQSLNSNSMNYLNQNPIISTNFNQFFSHIFTKNSSKKSINSREIQNRKNNTLKMESSLESSNELIFGAKTYESFNRNERKLFCHDFQRERDFEIKLLLNSKYLLVIDLKTNRLIFSLKLDVIIGWIFTSSTLKIYFHFGELLLIREEIFTEDLTQNSLLFELKEDLKELNEDLVDLEIKEILLKRNQKSVENSFGFHIQQQKLNSCVDSDSDLNIDRTVGYSGVHEMVVITEVNDWAKDVNGLAKGQRILELCKISLITLSYEQILDFLKTSQTVSVAVVQPNKDGSPRRGCFHPNCQRINRKEFKRSLENISIKMSTNSGDYENIGVVNNNNYSHQQRRQQLMSPTATPNQRPQHLRQNLLNNNSNNHSSQSSTTSSTFKEDLIKLITLNDCDIDDNDENKNENETNDRTDSHSSSRYSTATSTPYSSLERRQQRDDCVLTVAKPAFVVNVNPFSPGLLEDDHVNDENNDIQWPSLVATATRVINESNESRNDSILKEKVKELSEEKLRLNETIRQLKEENQRLHFESQTASQQLRKFTEWFFNSNTNNYEN